MENDDLMFIHSIQVNITSCSLKICQHLLNIHDVDRLSSKPTPMTAQQVYLDQVFAEHIKMTND